MKGLRKKCVVNEAVRIVAGTAFPGGQKVARSFQADVLTRKANLPPQLVRFRLYGGLAPVR
jgi:hypothetical protein